MTLPLPPIPPLLPLPPLAVAPGCAVIGDDDPPPARGLVWAIGNFDGVHKGHAAVIAQAGRLAARLGTGVGVLTFTPHPRKVFAPHAPLFMLTDDAQKQRALSHLGLRVVAMAAFTSAFAAMTPEAFIAERLRGWLHVGGVLTGPDFRFGAKRAGDTVLLAEAGRRHGFAVETAESYMREGAPISSSLIRDALGRGDVATAGAMMGRAWSMRGEIGHGAKLGRTLGFPTANMTLDAGCGLAHGVYAVRMAVDGVWRDGVASFGSRPTVDNGAPLFETYLFDFSGDLYGKTVEVAVIAHLRPELKFAGLEPLVEQMQRDAAAARNILAGARQP